MNNLYIYDDKKNKVAEIAPDDSGAIRILFPESIEKQTRDMVFDVFCKIPITSPQKQVDELTAGFEKSGFGVVMQKEALKHGIAKEKREATPEQIREANFIYESNLIERVNEIPYESILQELVEDKFGGHVSAWMLAKALAHDKTPLTLDLVCQMQGLITEEQSKYSRHRIPPRYRGKIRDCLVSIAGLVVDIPKKETLLDFFKSLNDQMKKLDGRDIGSVLKFAAKIHLEYESMHPFVDGNGRSGRLIVNYILAYFGYPPLVCTSGDKGRYYDGFRGQVQKDPVPMEEYFIEQYGMNSAVFK